MTTDQKTQAKKQKEDFELHVRMLMRQGLKQADARVQAWLQGPKGLEKMFEKVLPPEENGGNK